MRLLLITTTLVLLLTACASEPSGTPETVADDVAAGDVAAGETLYQANCAQCHGADLQGTDQGPPHLDAVYLPNHHGEFSFRAAVQNGVQPHHWQFGPMPPIDGLSEQDVTDIIAFVRAEQQLAGLLE
ncbi:c-type cytochrome [Euzebya rosea]|uniref:c-type cytochrome n=1 Tax=Euzebya rosea TaxID=2052804 RepID=UPI000D3ED119|nr:cytochrome c [Euzebya rosea]